jgi:hypothetical protein
MTTLEIGWEKIPENGWELNPRSQRNMKNTERNSKKTKTA